jgi:hypothetical protein
MLGQYASLENRAFFIQLGFQVMIVMFGAL